MHSQLTFHNKDIEIQLSPDAAAQSHKLNSPLIIEIQIYFSCLMGKRLAFYTDQPMEGCWQVESDEFNDMLKDSQAVTDNVYIRFNTVMTKACPVSDHLGPPPVSDFKIKNQTPYVPSWLKIDFKDGKWCGEYGWPASQADYKNTKQVRGDALKANAG